LRGRKPKPVEQRQREGKLGHRSLPAPVELVAAGFEKPEDLPVAASLLWDELVPILVAANVLNRVDRAALTALCVQWHRSVQARGVLAQEGLFALGSTGQVVAHPALEIERSAHLLFIRFAEQFGITPVARARIAAAVAGVAGVSMADELEKLLA
jgi:P27 family predicted phage terminase small subunit